MWKGKEHFYIEQIKELQEEKREISRFTVQQFIRKYGYEELYTKIQEVNKTLFKKIDASDYKGIIQFFLTTGAIDESYGDLVAVFHGKDVKQGDKRYIRAVLDGVEIPYDYEIENATAILESLSADELRRENALNFKLFAYVMVNGDEELQNAMVDAIVQNRVYEFIQKFSEKSLIKRKKWVPNIAEKNPQFIGDCLHCMHTIEGLDLFVAAAILYSVLFAARCFARLNFFRMGWRRNGRFRGRGKRRKAGCFQHWLGRGGKLTFLSFSGQGSRFIAKLGLRK